MAGADLSVIEPASGRRQSGLWLRRLCQAITIFLGVVFLIAGLGKIQQPYDFLSSVYSYRLFTARQGQVIAMMIPPLEIVIGLALLTQTCLRGGLLLCTILSAGFLVVRAYAVQTGNPIDCNCFGTQVLFPAKSIDWGSVGISGAQFAAALLALAASLWNPDVSRRGPAGPAR